MLRPTRLRIAHAIFNSMPVQYFFGEELAVLRMETIIQFKRDTLEEIQNKERAKDLCEGVLGKLKREKELREKKLLKEAHK